MQRIMNILHASILCRWLFSIADWLGVQWNNSRVVQWFLNPSQRARFLESLNEKTTNTTMGRYKNRKMMPLYTRESHFIP